MILDEIIEDFAHGDYPYELIDEFYKQNHPNDWYLFICESSDCIVRYQYHGSHKDALAYFSTMQTGSLKKMITNNPHDEWSLNNDVIVITPWAQTSQSSLWDRMVTTYV